MCIYIYNMLTIFSNKSTSLSYGAISDDATEHTGSMPWVIKQWEFRQQNIKILPVSGLCRTCQILMLLLCKDFQLSLLENLRSQLPETISQLAHKKTL